MLRQNNCKFLSITTDDNVRYFLERWYLQEKEMAKANWYNWAAKGSLQNSYFCFYSIDERLEWTFWAIFQNSEWNQCSKDFAQELQLVKTKFSRKAENPESDDIGGIDGEDSQSQKNDNDLESQEILEGSDSRIQMSTTFQQELLQTPSRKCNAGFTRDLCDFESILNSW